MRRNRPIILGIACTASIAFAVALCAILLLQSAGKLRPTGVGWGDGTRGRAYSVELLEGSIVLRTAAGMTPAPPGSYAYGNQTLAASDRGGIGYRRWNLTAGRGPQAPVLGTF